jgi:outer membrane protein OmpA-like peptidoglycan-associated protein
MSRRWIALGGVAAILAILVGSALWEAPRIERGLGARSRQLLADHGVSGVEVRFDGRDAVLTGPGVTDDVRALVARQPGVRRVQVQVAGRQTAAAAPTETGIAGPGSGQSVAPSPTVPAPGSAAEPASVVARRIVELLGPGGLRFEPASGQLAAPQPAVLDRIAALLAANPSIRLQVAGYTDALPPPGLTNVELSRRRAEAVAAYLAGHGVAAARMTVEGYGESRPVGDNGTAAGRAANRRVEITVLGG